MKPINTSQIAKSNDLQKLALAFDQNRQKRVVCFLSELTLK